MEFLRSNLLIQSSVIDAAWRYGTQKLEFLGSSCIFPKFAPQPIPEEYLAYGRARTHDDSYAIAKIAGIQMAKAQYGFRAISLMPTNLYGRGDSFDLQNSHVLPVLLRKFHDAKVAGASSVTVWGSGTPRREFLQVEDLADASVFLMLHYDSPDIVNVGVGADIEISELERLIAEVTGFEATSFLIGQSSTERLLSFWTFPGCPHSAGEPVRLFARELKKRTAGTRNNSRSHPS